MGGTDLSEIKDQNPGSGLGDSVDEITLILIAGMVGAATFAVLSAPVSGPAIICFFCVIA